jgi:DNA-directed RNA polymerase specialized sigma24 family protein
LGHDAREIGEMLDVGPGSVRVLLHRARQAMAAFLNERFKGGVSR